MIIEGIIVKMLTISKKIFLILFAIGFLSSSSHADVSNLYEKDGFRIHYVGNGGNCGGCEWIAIEGIIPPNAGDLFRQYANKHQFVGSQLSITFDSPGGSLVGSIRLGRVVRALGMHTSIGKTVPSEYGAYKTIKGKCYSACAYAFLGGVNRQAGEGEYGVHQFFTDALLKNPDGKIFTPIDFSIQQTITGLLLSYVIEMGVNTNLIVEANKTPPTEMNLLSQKKLKQYRISFNPKQYGGWNLEAYRNGLLIYSRTQDEKTQMTIFCNSSGKGVLLINYKLPAIKLDSFKSTFLYIKNFTLLKRNIERTVIRFKKRSNGYSLYVPLTKKDLYSLENNNNPNGSFGVSMSEPRVNSSLVYEEISLTGLSNGMRLVRKNCLK